eukprot:6193068-Pleurochrysis_carterae.AAC.2
MRGCEAGWLGRPRYDGSRATARRVATGRQDDSDGQFVVVQYTHGQSVNQFEHSCETHAGNGITCSARTWM